MDFTNIIDSVRELQTQVKGSVYTPNHPDYEATRRGWNLSINHYPALILVANDAQDVAAGVRFASDTGLGISVQLTGHGQQQPADNHLLIVTTRMQAVHIDPDARTARVEAGVIWGQVVAAASPYGLAPLLGTSPHVGVIGYTLGGGISWIGRKYGFAADRVRWIEVVSADGVIRRASPTEHSDLFWAVRGGGSNFGVVTAMEFDLVTLPTMYGGALEYHGHLAHQALRFYRDWIKTVPDELTSHFTILKYPSFPQVPEAMRGKIVVIVRAVYAGSAADGAALIQPWLDWETPAQNNFREMPFTEIGAVSNEPVNPTPTNPSNELFHELTDDMIDVMVRFATNPDSPLVFNELRHAGGAMSRAGANDSAISNRDAQFYMQFGGVAPTPDLKAAIDNYRQAYRDALRPYLRGNVYMNFLWGIDARNRVRDAFPPSTFERLVKVKQTYDPHNMFRFSYQLVPATAEA